MFLENYKNNFTNLKIKFSIVFFNFSALILCVIFGAFFYEGSIAGENDDLAYVSPLFYSTIFDFFKYFYNEFGVLGGTIIGFPWVTVAHIFSISPFEFPWWFPASLNLFYLIASPINLIYSLRIVLLEKKQFYFLFLFTLLFWILNPLTFKITLDGRATNLGGYWAPLFLLTTCMALYSGLDEYKLYQKWTLLILAYIPLTLYASLFVLSLPFLIVIYTILKISKGKLQYIKNITPLLILNAVGALITWTAPGFTKYKTSVGFAIPEFSKLISIFIAAYIRTINTIYNYIFGTQFDYYYWIHTFILGSLCFAGVQYIRLFLNGKKNIFQSKSFSLYFLAFGFFLTFHTATISTLFVETYPLYHQFFPSLLLVIGLGLFFLWVFRVFKFYMLFVKLKTKFYESILRLIKTSPQKSFVIIFLIILFSLGGFTLSRIERIVNIYQEEIWIGNSLWTLRRDILNSYQTKNQKLFYLKECPARFTYWVDGLD